jgi:hypothetical protein
MNGMKSRSDFISLKFSKVPLFYERLRFREWLRVGNKHFDSISFLKKHPEQNTISNRETA